MAQHGHTEIMQGNLIGIFKVIGIGHLFIIQDFQVYARSSESIRSMSSFFSTREEDDVYRINIERNNRILVLTDTRSTSSYLRNMGMRWHFLVAEV